LLGLAHSALEIRNAAVADLGRLGEIAAPRRLLGFDAGLIDLLLDLTHAACLSSPC
jgi:hypothetical protein